MKVTVIEECGYWSSLAGVGLNKGLTSLICDFRQNVDDPWQERNDEIADKVERAAKALSKHDGGHNKCLETMTLILDITAPRYFWQEFDTYRVGVTKNSESTMHTIHKRLLVQNDFEKPLSPAILGAVNAYLVLYQESRSNHDLEMFKNQLPEGFLQRRIVSMNYKALRNIILQRQTHRLAIWQDLIGDIKFQVSHPEMLP